MKSRTILLAALFCLCVPALTSSTFAPPVRKTPAIPRIPATSTPSGYPAVTSVSPAKVTAGAAGFTLVVTGSGFVTTTAIQVGDVVVPTTYVSATQVKAAVGAEDILNAGMYPVIALNGDDTSASGAAVNLEVDNAVPSILLFIPGWLAVGTPSTPVPVIGSGFTPETVIDVNGSARVTAYYSSSQVDVVFTTADLATGGNLAVTAVNPSPGGGTSTSTSFLVGTPTPQPYILSISPSPIFASTTASSITVTATGITTASTVQWNGTNLTITTTGTNNYGEQYIVAAVPASLVAKAGTANITVTTPTSIPAVSTAMKVTIVNPPAPTLTSISPTAGPLGTTTLVTLYGTNFASNTVVSYNGTALPTSFSNSTTLIATLPAASVPLPGNGSFTVTTPAPGGGTSAAMIYTAYIGIANNDMVYNPANGLFYVSVPSSAGPPYGNSVVSVDPETGALGTPIYVGSEPNLMAISSDGTVLWVGLDGASAVRQVNLTAGTAGLQFSLGGNGGVYATPGTALALVALPGAPNSVVVSSNAGISNSALAIYDSGVVRGTASGSYSNGTANALQANGTKSEIYAGGYLEYYVFTYGASGLTLKTSVTTGTFANYEGSDMQLAGGDIYTDLGKVYDAEVGALLGTFYMSGSNVATGPAFADTTLDKVFILDNSAQYSETYNQIQVFNASSYSLATASVIPVSIAATSIYTGGATSTRLARWGTNGLAFRTASGVYSLRSNLVKDLSSVSADLGVTLAATGSNATGANSTFTATVTNGGPSASTNIALTALIPSTGVLVSATPSQGSCSTSGVVACDLGGLANGAKATVTFVVKQMTAGSSTLTVQVSGSETDPNLANNQASATVTITGSAYNPAPSIVSISPATVLAGSSDTVLTVNGTGFVSGSAILLNGAKLSTTLVNSTQLTATAPKAQLAALGWAAVTVTTPTPGGGTSNAVPLTVYSVTTLGINHIVYDPYSRKIMASLGSGSSTVAGNSIAAITPETGTVGTPVAIGSNPTNLALTSDGQILYTILTGSQSVARFNMLTQQADYSYVVPADPNADGIQGLRGIAAQPGTENTIALDLGSWAGNAIYDFNPANKTAAIRGAASGPYSGSCIQFLDAGDLLAFDVDDSGATFDHYTVTSAGFQYYNYSQYSESTLDDFGCFQLSGGLAFANAGGVANPATEPATQLGIFQEENGGYNGEFTVAPDTSLERAFFVTGQQDSDTFNGLAAFDTTTYLPTVNVGLNFQATEGQTSFGILDTIRWGQDGLAILTNSGHLYLLRGALVVPQFLNQNKAATLASITPASLTHGTGNTLLTLTGSNFVPGVAVTWNGGYRTTTIVDATHVTVAIPASDLAAAGTGSLVATNPGASGSAALTVTVQ
jgi:hypothetical protein